MSEVGFVEGRNIAIEYRWAVISTIDCPAWEVHMLAAWTVRLINYFVPTTTFDFIQRMAPRTWLSRAFETSRRREVLSFGRAAEKAARHRARDGEWHHRLIAKLVPAAVERRRLNSDILAWMIGQGGVEIPTDGYLTLALALRSFFTPALGRFALTKLQRIRRAGLLVLGAMTSMTSPVRGSIRLHGDAGPCEPIIWRSRSARIRVR